MYNTNTTMSFTPKHIPVNMNMEIYVNREKFPLNSQYQLGFLKVAIQWLNVPFTSLYTQ